MSDSWPDVLGRSRLTTKVESAVGGPARLAVVSVLAGVLALDSADQATVGASAVQLKAALHVGNTQIGLLAALSSAVGALGTLPMGALVDRVSRTRLLAVALLLWSLAMIVSGASTSFTMLLLTRLALGLLTAVAGPAVASLVGDFFPAADRGRIYGYVVTGELAGAGLGLIVAGNLASSLNWRSSFWFLALPSAGLGYVVWRWLPEPARGGASRLKRGATSLLSSVNSDQRQDASERADSLDADANGEHSDFRSLFRAQSVTPHADKVLPADTADRSLWWASKYVLSIRTNVTLVIASVLGYFFFSGVRTFAIVFVRGRFGVSQGDATFMLALIGVGGVAGALITGRLADGLIGRGRITARLTVAGAAYLLASAVFLPGLLAGSVLLAIPLFMIGAAAIGGANPPLDAARLDLVPYRLWGRAESVRSVLRSTLQAAAPLVFGYVSVQFGGSGTGTGTGEATSPQPHHAVGLDRSFLIMLVPLIAAGLLVLLYARRTYPRDVATAIASDDESAASHPKTALQTHS